MNRFRAAIAGTGLALTMAACSGNSSLDHLTQAARDRYESTVGGAINQGKDKLQNAYDTASGCRQKGIGCLTDDAAQQIASKLIELVCPSDVESVEGKAACAVAVAQQAGNLALASMDRREAHVTYDDGKKVCTLTFGARAIDFITVNISASNISKACQPHATTTLAA